MATIDITNIDEAFKKLSDTILDRLESLQEKTQMEDEHFSSAVAGSIAAVMDGAVKAVDSTKRHELIDEQIGTEKLRQEELRRIIAIRVQEELAEKIKNGGVVASYQYYVNGVDGATAWTTNINSVVGPILDVTFADGDGVSLYAAQIDTELKRGEAIESKMQIDETHSAQDLAIKVQQELAEKIKNGGVVASYQYYVNGVDGATAWTTNINSVVGPILSVTFADGDGVSIYAAQIDTELKRGEAIESKMQIDETHSAQDLAIKVQQELAEKIKNGDVQMTYAYFADGKGAPIVTTTDIRDVIGPILEITYTPGSSASIYSAQLANEFKRGDAILAEIDVSTKRANEIDQKTEDGKNITLMEIAVKAQQELEGKLKNGEIEITYLWFDDDDVGHATTDPLAIDGRLTGVTYNVLNKGVSTAAVTIADAAAGQSLKLRQKGALDDAKQVKTAELVGNTVSLIESGGGTASVEIWTALKNAVNAIEAGTYPDAP